MALVTDLKIIEELPDTLAIHYGKLGKDLQRAHETTTVIPNVGVPVNLPQFDMQAALRDVFTKYERNPVVQNARAGTQSVEGTLDELYAPFRGVRGFLFPRRRSVARERRAVELEEVVGSCVHKLCPLGVFAMDNLVESIGFFGTLSSFIAGACWVANSNIFSLGHDNEYESFGYLFGGLLVAVVGIGGVGSSLGIYEERKIIAEQGRAAARHVDTKIKELF